MLRLIGGGFRFKAQSPIVVFIALNVLILLGSCVNKGLLIMRCWPKSLSHFLVSVMLFCSCVNGVPEENEFVVKIVGGPRIAKRLAMDLGVLYKGPVKGFKNTYVLLPVDSVHSKYSKRNNNFSKRLVEDARVIWFERQEVKQRQKRDFLYDSWPSLMSKRVSIENEAMFNDELWAQEWYMQDTRTRPDLPKLDLNVLPVYKAGVTGEGVRISILDDGLEYTHDDLTRNYDPKISWNCNDDNADPIPRYDSTRENSHGTRCAGEVAMIANNEKCGVGIAFNAKIGGVKLLDGLVNDRIEGTALTFAHHLVDIYSASWGPNDDGKTVDGPGRLATEALVRGVTEGRDGKGCIYVWASGNGGDKGDNCNCDGYLASPYTISIGSASQRGAFPWYGEACASTLAVTYSSGAYQDQMIATTDLHNQCTIKHTGTSASAPLAAGIIALALEVNPNLTWRDVQHLIVWSSEFEPVSVNPGWQRNAAGLWFNTRFGFGLMNAFGLVAAAANWTTVPTKRVCVLKSFAGRRQMKYKHSSKFDFDSDGCNNTKNKVKHVEHVEVVTDIDYSVRGSLEIYITSPAETQIQILNSRPYDNSESGFRNWTFMSVATWGELAYGTWTVRIEDNVGPNSNRGFVNRIQIKLHGTSEMPPHMFNGRRVYNRYYNYIRSRMILDEIDGKRAEPTLNNFENEIVAN